MEEPGSRDLNSRLRNVKQCSSKSNDEFHENNSDTQALGTQITTNDPVDAPKSEHTAGHTIEDHSEPVMESHDPIRPTENKKCPFCAELIKAEAIKCKHCNSNLVQPPQENASPSAPTAKARSIKESDGVVLILLGGVVALYFALFFDVSVAVRRQKCRQSRLGGGPANGRDCGLGGSSIGCDSLGTGTGTFGCAHCSAWAAALDRG